MRVFAIAAAALLVACSESAPSDAMQEEVAETPVIASPAGAPDAIEELPEPDQDMQDGFAPARAAIDEFCDNEAACVRNQRENLATYVKIMAAFDDPNGTVAERCMRSGLSDGSVDWTVAAPCMQAAAKGKPIGGRLD